MDYKRCWAAVDLAALSHNYHCIRRFLSPGCRYLAIVKADGYGHGAATVAGQLQKDGADWFGVATMEEALDLRRQGIYRPILVLGYTDPAAAPLLASNTITQTLFSEEYALQLAAEAAKAGCVVDCHVKIDTGMSRLGFDAENENTVLMVEKLAQSGSLHITGIFTHFAVSDEEDRESRAYTREQFDLFTAVIAKAEEKLGRKFALRHCANTGAVAYWPEMMLDMVRPGLLLYGYGDGARRLGLRPVMRLMTSVSTIKVYEPGTSVSYGRIFKTERTTRMGVVPYGYADGFFRCLSNRCSLMTAYGPAPQRGRICMDMCMIDLTDLPEVDVGDEIEIFGPENPVERLADLAGTIPYELTCAVSKRVPRVYIENGKETERELLLRF